jgi:hypothetical protein
MSPPFMSPPFDPDDEFIVDEVGQWATKTAVKARITKLGGTVLDHSGSAAAVIDKIVSAINPYGLWLSKIRSLGATPAEGFELVAGPRGQHRIGWSL